MKPGGRRTWPLSSKGNCDANIWRKWGAYRQLLVQCRLFKVLFSIKRHTHFLYYAYTVSSRQFSLLFIQIIKYFIWIGLKISPLFSVKKCFEVDLAKREVTEKCTPCFNTGYFNFSVILISLIFMFIFYLITKCLVDLYYCVSSVIYNFYFVLSEILFIPIKFIQFYSIHFCKSDFIFFVLTFNSFYKYLIHKEQGV